MGSPMRIRARDKGDDIEVKVLMRHNMETGQRKDGSGNVIPAHHITSLVAKCNDKIVLDAQFGPAVSKDPYLAFNFKGGAKGDKVTVSWTDNKGDSRTDEAVIS
jgi:sulfur-oxidizing protein SoxZ